MSADVCASARRGRSWVGRVFAVWAVTLFVTIAGHAQSAWESRDIGAVASAGSSTITTGGVTLVGSGADIWDRADEFHFHYQAWTGDGEFIARVVSMQNTHPWAKAGLMVRETLAPGSRNVMSLATPENGVGLQHRAVTGDFTTLSISRWWSDFPMWVRIVRVGDTFTGYWSSSGEVWTNAGTVTLSAAPATMYIGLAVTSHNDGVGCQVVFDNIRFTGSGTPPPAGAPTITSATTATATVGSPFSYTITATNSPTSYSTSPLPSGLSLNATSGVISGTPTAAGDHNITLTATNSTGSGTANLFLQIASQGASPWQTQDVGAVAAAGSSSESGGVVTVRGSGADIWGTADEFHFRHQSANGSGEFIARVLSLQFTHAWAKAGVMLRESLTPGSRYVMICATPESGTAFQHRAATGDVTDINGISWWTSFPVWVKVVRNGDVFTGYWSWDATTWTNSGSATLPGAAATMYFGLAVTSHNDGVVATATFDRVQFTPSGSPPPPPPSGAPSAPASLIATPVSPTQVNLSWQDTSNNEDSFEVERYPPASGRTFAVIATLPANTTSFQDTTVDTSTQYEYRVRARNASGGSSYSNGGSAATLPTRGAWGYTDIRSSTLQGSNSSSGNTITIRGCGSDIWGSSDQFRFVYQEVLGDVTVEAQVSSITRTHAWAKAGVMIRGWDGALVTSADEQSNVFVYQTPDNVVASQVRASRDGNTTISAALWNAPSYWVRLVRTGSRIVASASPDGIAWTPLATYDGVVPDRILVGFAVTSHDPSQLATAVFTDPFIR